MLSSSQNSTASTTASKPQIYDVATDYPRIASLGSLRVLLKTNATSVKCDLGIPRRTEDDAAGAENRAVVDGVMSKDVDVHDGRLSDVRSSSSTC